MKIENLARSFNARVDCNIEHPDHGMIPFTACPLEADAGNELAKAVFEYMLANKLKYDKLPVSPHVAIAKEFDARTWRDSELTRADAMFNRVTDGVKGIGTLAQWKLYRISLRDWPSTKGFPSEDSRPVAPDAA